MKNIPAWPRRPLVGVLPAIISIGLAPIAALGANPPRAATRPSATAPARVADAGRGATPARVKTAIQKAVDCIYAQQAHDNWEIVQTRGPANDPGVANGLQWTGLTAISTYALLAAGENQTDKRLSSAIEFLVQNPSQGVYASACRCLVWSRINLTPARHAAAQKDVDFLIKCMKTAGDAKGLFFYGLPRGPKDGKYDHSTSQMAALGLSVMVPEGFEIPRDFWRTTEEAWQHHQEPDGAWTYNGDPATKRVSMSAAGVATLFITQSLLREKADCKGSVDDPHISNGLKWLGSNFESTFETNSTRGHHLEQYALFTVSRVGVASGLRYFGTVDWYQRGADFLISTQKPDGSWFSDFPAGTPLGLLFLAYGSSPVVLNKLEYTVGPESGKMSGAQWNQRPQDLLNFTDWMGHQLEHRLNWQVVSLSSAIDAMHDAPIFFIAGNQPLNFAEEDRAKLRQFVEEGGMIVGNADCDSRAFSESFMKLGAELFPTHEFRELPATHPIYTNEQYKAAHFKHPMRMQGISNGVRELMLLPSADVSRAFQNRSATLQADVYDLFDDIVLYAIDASSLSRKGETYIVREDPAAPIAKTIKLARLQYGGNWDPEPGGWRRLAAVLHNTQKIALQVETVTLGDGKLITTPAPATASVPRPSDKEIRQMAAKRIPPADLAAAAGDAPAKMQALIDAKIQEIRKELDAADAARSAGSLDLKVAHLTGTEPLKLTDAERGEIKKFIEAGGTLIIDAAGGSTQFASSAEQMLIDTFGPDARQIESPLEPDAPIYRQPGHTVDEVQYRQFARSRISSAKKSQLRAIKIGGRVAIIYSREDLGAGLVGEPVDGITGYSPASATELMADIVLYSSGKPAK